ncbi:hypothetical protein P153DRAFT_63380 [Dothidotthia symphoricarpi CBS 119687]|uniref:Cupredoxin n=1 Tax=Dothidotthia symphoricarpi CBS 119687 TaxID=1392245 RepID=A0A6A6A8Y4_9PLEO|nr:uncharacterized protein P153DRAFT_63380 [Dothidotthia symphoricarpi CBS 119687]KAF2127288.1 hypothetical protein P153DRAFT_63380 [Dothidotthia symphoricarpi CBS 119687]
MKHVTVLSLVVSLAAAQMSVMSLAPAASNGPMTHTIVVGGLKPVETGMAAILGYTPESITANQGDMVVFKFMQKNHTVTQSTFAEPCKKKEGGIDSGFMPNPDGTADVQFNMTVTTTDPLWFYCRQQTGTHCGKGMVFSINPATTGDKTMVDFKQLAINQNGTDLKLGAIQSVNPNAAAAPTTVTVQAGTGTGASALATATVVAGQGTNSQGNTCSCSCLCGTNSFPANAAVNNFGGFAGMMIA